MSGGRIPASRGGFRVTLHRYVLTGTGQPVGEYNAPREGLACVEATLRTRSLRRKGPSGAWPRWRLRITGRRLVFSLGICLLVSTSVLFQPDFHRLLAPGQVVRAWLDYFGGCLLMGAPIMLALTAAEALTQGWSRLAIWLASFVALAFGATLGATLLLPYYGLHWKAWGSPPFLADVAYWTLIGGGVAVIYGFQQGALAAASALHRAQIDQAALAKQMMEARLQVVRAQIEPHFLFNTLANVKRLCQTDVGGGVAMLDNLIRYLRAALPRMREEQSTLGQEGELVQAYLEVLKMRMGTRLRFSVDIPAPLAAQPFPPMILLTLAENAIKHGLTPVGGGTISVHAAALGSHLVIRLADDGAGFGAAATGGTGVGLANTRARLAALHGPTAELSFLANEPRGVVAVIDVPLAPAVRAAEDAASPKGRTGGEQAAERAGAKATR